jgi:hypothetical protein
MECYTLELVHECAGVAPMLRSVECAYILTMHGTETFPWLHGVTARTYVQRNRGFRACRKTREGGVVVDATNQDLLHAYRSVFARADTSVPVLVFEDDARLTRTAREDLVAVDRFVATHAFSIYTLGSIGVMVPHGGRHWRFAGSLLGASHAIIYSPDAARAVLDSCVSAREHVDGAILGLMPAKITYTRPIAYQVLDANAKSANSSTWCTRCDGGILDAAIRKLTWVYFGALGLQTERGWYAMYVVNKLLMPVAAVLVLGLVVLCWLALRALVFRAWQINV